MHYHKQPSPDILARLSRLEFADPDSAAEVALRGCDEVEQEVLLTLRAIADGVFRLAVNRPDRPLPPLGPVPLDHLPPASASSRKRGSEVTLATDSGSIGIDAATTRLSLLAGAGRGAIPMILPEARQILGFSGDRFGLGLPLASGTPFYGFGERTGRLNKAGARMNFWNVDVCADHPYGNHRDDYDPTYASIPVAIWRCRVGRRVGWAAMLIDNAGPAFFNCQSRDFLEPDLLYGGTLAGEPAFIFIVGATLAEVTSRLLRVTGTPAMPPLWSLGVHQCRWGYDSEEEYRRVVEGYAERGLPLHALWLDIDYMDRYRVFTWHPNRVPDPKKLARWMHERQVRLVTIIDPGVAAANDNPLYKEGVREDVFCRAPSGKHFVGMVWPGKTVFPDFTQAHARSWWARHLADHLRLGIDGIWNDMNDPATGAVDPQDMLFADGSQPHEFGHNTYGLHMAEATAEAFDLARPKERPFVLTRSASTGIQRTAAVWTGDNVSSWAHLRMSIPETLNLALSGVSFNGPDIGGFMEDTSAELLVRWYQAAALFPFFRNHSNINTAHQEPWSFGRGPLEMIRAAILFRCRMLAYLYTCFLSHIRTGEPVIRPLLYFDDDARFETVEDAYAVGADVFVAPIVQQGARSRMVLLPTGSRYVDLGRDRLVEGGEIFERSAELEEMVVFVREGAVVCEPIPPGGSWSGWDLDLRKAQWRIHLFGARAAGEVLIDDGITRPSGEQKAGEVRLEGSLLRIPFSARRLREVVTYGRGPGAIRLADGGVLAEVSEESMDSRLLPATADEGGFVRLYRKSTRRSRS